VGWHMSWTSSLNGPMILYPRANSPIDFSTHVPKVIMREKVLTAPTLTLMCSVPNRGAVGTVSLAAQLTSQPMPLRL
jgi:hypothetical protein